MWLIFLFCSLFAPNHKYYVSKCHIDYVPEQSALQVRLHFFIEDVEAQMKSDGYPKTRLFTKWEAKDADEHLLKYLNDHLVFSINGKKVSYKFIGRETDPDLQGAWCYLEIGNVEQLESIGITNTILVDEFEQQQNIILLNRPGHKSSYLMLNRQKRTDTINFSVNE